MPFATPRKKRNTITTFVLAITAKRLDNPIKSAIWIHYLLVNFLLRKYAIITPTTHPKGKIPFIKLKELVFSSFVMPLYI